MTRERRMDIAIGLLVWGAVVSIPALLLAAWWFSNPALLFGLAIPIIFFMAG